MNSKNFSSDVIANTLCVHKNTDKILFAVNFWSNITCNARWSAFAGPNEAFASCLLYITHLLTCSIRSCGQSLKQMRNLNYVRGNTDECSKHLCSSFICRHSRYMVVKRTKNIQGGLFKTQLKTYIYNKCWIWPPASTLHSWIRLTKFVKTCFNIFLSILAICSVIRFFKS